MVNSNHLQPGMIVSIQGKLYRVESSLKVTVAKGNPFIKAKLRDLEANKVVEKNFKLNQTIEDVVLQEQTLEFLYLEGKDYLFLNVDTLDQVLVPGKIVANKANYLKEGVEVKASFYGDVIFSIELPQFIELIVGSTEKEKGGANSSKVAIMETGARVEVPSFIEDGDMIKVDTRSDEYIQRV